MNAQRDVGLAKRDAFDEGIVAQQAADETVLQYDRCQAQKVIDGAKNELQQANKSREVLQEQYDRLKSHTDSLTKGKTDLASQTQNVAQQGVNAVISLQTKCKQLESENARINGDYKTLWDIAQQQHEQGTSLQEQVQTEKSQKEVNGTQAMQLQQDLQTALSQKQAAEAEARRLQQDLQAETKQKQAAQAQADQLQQSLKTQGIATDTKGQKAADDLQAKKDELDAVKAQWTEGRVTCFRGDINGRFEFTK